MTRPTPIPGYIALITVFALAFAMLITCATVHANAPTLSERIVAVVPSIGSKREPTVDAGELAEAVIEVSKGNRQWAALLLTVAAHESALSARIAGGGCRIHECDQGRAAGLFQIHRNEQNVDTWGSTDLAVQTREASRMLRQAFYRCGALHEGWQLQTLRAYAGKRCSEPLRGEGERVATYRKVLARL